MTRDELIALRNELQALADQLNKIGDYNAGAEHIRAAISSCLKLTQHLVDRMRRP